MKKDSYYFSHDANARKDEKILTLLAAHGYEGYGIYWALVEMMFENVDTAISRKLLNGIAYDMRIEIALLKKVITTCYTVKLFQADKEKIWSNSLRRRKAEWDEKKKKRSEAGKRGMATRWSSDNNVITADNNVITNNNKGKEIKGKEIKRSNSAKALVLPKQDDVEQQKILKQEYQELSKQLLEMDTKTIWFRLKEFIQTKKPVFIEPFVDTWNVAAANYGLASIQAISDSRRKKFSTRMHEECFDFLLILEKIKTSGHLKGDNTQGWKATFDWVIENDKNYLKILEGNYK